MAEFLFGREHVERYRATNGEEGHDWREGSKILILTTTGHKSGKERLTPLIYGRDGDNYLVVASQGGMPEHPSWYFNLQAEPDIEIQVLADKIKVKARDATPEERPELWRRMNDEWRYYDDYQKNTDREIPVVVLEPV
jgi:deazaflavin-dependent oxidoreductase (nitroreductase family)